MGNCSITIHALGTHHNHDNPHDINQMVVAFVDKLKAAGHHVTHAHLHHGGSEDMLDPKASTRSGAFGALAAAASALALIAAITLFHPVPARAADLPAVPKLAKPVVTPGFTWSGAYVGGFAGISVSRNRYDFAGEANSGTFFGNGALFGGYAGANYQTGNLVYGVEVDGAFANLKGGNACFPSSGLQCQVESGGLFGLRGRIGYTVGGLPQPVSLAGYVPGTNRWNDMLLFVDGGGAVRTIHANIPGLGQSETTKVGWSVGGGLEVPVSDNIIARVHYLHNDFRDHNCAPDCTGGIPIDTTVRMKEDLVTGGLAYKF